MANCKYCGQPAGLLRYAHRECDKKFDTARNEILHQALAAIQHGGSMAELKERLGNIARSSYVNPDTERALLIKAWERALDGFLEDGLLDASEEKRLTECKTYFLLNQSELDRNGALTKTVKAGAIRDLTEGKIPDRVNIEGALAFNLQKSERIIWVFPNTEYLEDKTRRSYVGRSHGVSVRIAKGVYYRTSAFKGHPVEHTERVNHGKGIMAITDKHIYYHGKKSFRIPHSKIVSFEPYSDGVGIMRDAANAKNQIFINGDGWFTYNVLANINNL